MKKAFYIVMLLILLLLTSCNMRRDIELEDRIIDPSNFPDEVFREYIAENFDTDKNGILSIQEIRSVTEINVEDEEIKDLKGVEFFLNLQKLNCSSNKLTDLDVSYNLKLSEIDCSYNEIEKLDLSYNSYLVELDCGSNKLNKLNVSCNMHGQ